PARPPSPRRLRLLRHVLRPVFRLFPAGGRCRVKSSLKVLLGVAPLTAAPEPAAPESEGEGFPAADQPAVLPVRLSEGINIVGYVRSEHGIGESARLCARAADAVGLPFSLYDYNAGNNSRVADATWEERIRDDHVHEVNLFHINADQMPLAH